MPAPESIAFSLASAWLKAEWQVAALVDCGSQLFGKRWRWLRHLATETCAAFAEKPTDRPALAHFIFANRRFRRGFWLRRPEVRTPTWNLPRLRTIGELAAWLRMSVRELEWFADLRGLEAKGGSPRLRHYHYRPLHKRFGQVRLIEAPKPRLKELQRQLLIEILEPIALHDAAHGFRCGRSIHTFAAPHVGQQVVLKIDLQDFFPSIHAARVRVLFRSIGYSIEVSKLLTGLCINTAPRDVWENLPDVSREEQWRLDSVYHRPHLPQGAPTSPALANLAAYRLDCRLAALASRAGGRYTRYADDLAFSGDASFAKQIARFQVQACAIILDEDFRIHHRKTRIMRPGVRQYLAGLVVNDRLNIRRDDYDELKAILTNCVRHGPASQNCAAHPDFRNHLIGRISFVTQVNPNRGAKLHAIFERIAW